MKKFKFIALAVGAVFLLSACQSLKDGLTTQKKNTNDEFLVQKKNPLVLPPEFNELPLPKKESENKESINESNVTSVQELLGKSVKQSNNKDSSKKLDQTLEEYIMKKINKN